MKSLVMVTLLVTFGFAQRASSAHYQPSVGAARVADALDTAAAQDPPTAPQRVEWSEAQLAKLRSHSPLGAPPPSPTNRYADDPHAAELGQRLFFDKRLSSNGEIACASCHDPALGFADGEQVFDGLAVGTRHSPSLWNVAYQRWFFWDGRADSLWAQAVQPFESALEMGGDRAALAHLVANDAKLRAAYERVFGSLLDTAHLPAHAKPVADDATHAANVAWLALDEIERRALNRFIANVGKSFEAYERKLVRRVAPFDRFVAGDASALDLSAQRGAQLFIGRANCRSCHGGPNFSDGEFHNIGVPPLDADAAQDAARYAGIQRVLADPFNAASEYSDARTGEHVLHLETLRLTPQSFGEFRVPSLRNVALAPPYMHQGQYATLDLVLRYYSTLEGATRVGHHQELTLKPLDLTEQERADLHAFLEALTGAPPEAKWLAPLGD